MTEIYERAQGELDAAVATFEREKAALFRADGTPQFSAATHTERLGALTERLHAVAERARAVAEAEVVSVNRALEAEHNDPAARLTTAQIQEANARATFVREDALGLPLDQLARRIRGVRAAGGDAISAFLWGRYARGRLATERGAAQERGASAATRPDYQAVEAALAELEAGHAPAAALTKAQAAQRIRRAREFQAATGRRVGELDGSLAALRGRLASSGRYDF